MIDSEILIPDVWSSLHRKSQPLTSQVPISELALEAIRDFDYQTDGITSFLPFALPAIPQTFGIGVIVGASGTGKSTLLAEFGKPMQHDWDDRAIIDHFDTAKEAQDKFYAVGLTSIPTWMKPFGVLSNGEKFRAQLAKGLQTNAVIDEYTSVVDRNIAQAASRSLRKYVTNQGLTGIVIATCHRDILPYLQPDWIIDTDAGMFVIEPKECLRLKPLVVEVYEVNAAMWNIYAQHHYLKADLSPFARCYAAIISNQPAAFYAVISYPSGTVRNAFRGHRLVTHPDYQGLGAGPRLADFVAANYVDNGKRFFAKTAHPRLGEYREQSLEWKPTTKNKRFRTDVIADEQRQKRRQRFVSWTLNPNRFTYSHEFIKGVSND
jgi:ABC-type lipoprotein export system ATPase subunit/GNAT superfamily N-acetyltransferase